MVEQPYSQVPLEQIQLASVSPGRNTNALPPNDLPARRSEDSESDVSYHDNLEDEPFDEKKGPIRLDHDMDEEEGDGFPVEPRRVRCAPCCPSLTDRPSCGHAESLPGPWPCSSVSLRSPR